MYQSGLRSLTLGEPGDSKRKLAVADIVDLTESPTFTESTIQVQSPESYNTYAVEDTSSARKARDPYQLSVQDAAYALQELHNHRDTDDQTPRASQSWPVPATQGLVPKRKRTEDDSDLHRNVRDLLAYPSFEGSSWTPKSATVPTSYPTSAYLTPRATPIPGGNWTSVKRTRLTPPEVDREAFLRAREAYGQHHLIPAV
jgi:hypothetical protein